MRIALLAALILPALACSDSTRTEAGKPPGAQPGFIYSEWRHANHSNGGYWYRTHHLITAKDGTERAHVVFFLPGYDRHWIYWWDLDTRRFFARTSTKEHPDSEERASSEFWKGRPLWCLIEGETFTFEQLVKAKWAAPSREPPTSRGIAIDFPPPDLPVKDWSPKK